MSATNTAHLNRVRTQIEEHVTAFLAKCLDDGFADFRMSDLTSYVVHKVHCAPDSPGRILRLLRKSSAVDVYVLSRGDSLYRIEAVGARKRVP